MEVKPEQAAKKCVVLLSSGRFQDIDAEKTEDGKYAPTCPRGITASRSPRRDFLPYEIPKAQISLGQTNSTTIHDGRGDVRRRRGAGVRLLRRCNRQRDDKIRAERLGQGRPAAPTYTATSDAAGKFKVSLTGYKKKIRPLSGQRREVADQNRTRRQDDRLSIVVDTRRSVGQAAFDDTLSFRAGFEESLRHLPGQTQRAAQTHRRDPGLCAVDGQGRFPPAG